MSAYPRGIEPFEAVDSFWIMEPSIKSPLLADRMRLGRDQASIGATERFYRLVWPERAGVLRLAAVLTRSSVEAEELAQDALVKAFKAIDTFEEGTDVRAWLAAILRNARIDRLRAAGLRPAMSIDDLPFEPVQPAASISVEAQWQEPREILESFSDQQVIDALAAVPEEIRWTLLLVDVEGLDQVDAGRVLAIPVGTVKSRLHRGRAMLRAALLPLARDRRLVGDGEHQLSSDGRAS